MKYFLVFLLFSLSLAEHCPKFCGVHVHKFIRHCTNGGAEEACGRLKERMLPECQPMLSDAMVCLPSLQRVCGLSVTLWREDEKDDRETEEIFMHGTIHCVMEKFDFLDPQCQATATVQHLRTRSIHKRCMIASGAYMRDCLQNEANDWSCQFRRTQLLNMGCREILADMLTCAQDVEAFCPLPPRRTNPFPIPAIEPMPMPPMPVPMPVEGNPPSTMPSVAVDPIPQTLTQPSSTTTTPAIFPGAGVFPSLPMPFMMPGFPSHHEGKMIRKIMKHCIATHIDDFSPQCQNTKLMQHVRNNLKDSMEESFEEATWTPHRMCLRLHQRLGTRGLCTVVSGLAFLGICLVWLIRERQRRSRLRSARLENMPPKQGAWSTSLCGSWASVVPDWRTCLPSFCCPQLQSALNQAELDDRDVAAADVCLNMYKPMMLTNVYRDRQALRAKFDIPEASCEDMLTSVFCTPCAVAQHARELDARLNVAQGNTPLAYVPQTDGDLSDPQKPINGVPLAEIMKL